MRLTARTRARDAAMWSAAVRRCADVV